MRDCESVSVVNACTRNQKSDGSLFLSLCRNIRNKWRRKEELFIKLSHPVHIEHLAPVALNIFCEEVESTLNVPCLIALMRLINKIEIQGKLSIL